MNLKQFSGEDKTELAMIDVAKAVLEENGQVMYFEDLLKEVTEFLELSDSEMEEAMAQFYTDLNVDGGFISLGENSWGLRSWYPIDFINEELTYKNDKEDRPKRRKPVEGEMDSLDDELAAEEELDLVEEYDDLENEGFDDDDEDTEIEPDFDSLDFDETSADEEEDAELREYESDLSELGADDELDEEDDDEIILDEDDDDLLDEELEED